MPEKRDMPEYKIDKEYSARISILRFLLIVLVVYIHSYSDEIRFADTIQAMNSPPQLQYIKEIFSLIICKAAVPLFFLISGILLYRKSFTWINNFQKKVKTIGIPYMFWNLFWIFLFFIMQSISLSEPYFSNSDNIIRNFGIKEWIHAFFGINRTGVLYYPFLYPFWFLKDLFILNLAATVIKISIDKMPFLFFIIASGLWLCDLCIYIVSPEALFFFALGYFIVKYKLDIKIIDKIGYLEISVLYALAIYVEVLAPNLISIIHKISILIGIVFFVKLSGFFVRRERIGEVFINLSGYTFFIYAFHEYSLRIIKKLMARFFLQTALVQLLEYVFLPVLIIIISIIVGKLFGKIWPKLYSLVTGGR